MIRRVRRLGAPASAPRDTEMRILVGSCLSTTSTSDIASLAGIHSYRLFPWKKFQRWGASYTNSPGCSVVDLAQSQRCHSIAFECRAARILHV